MAPEATDDARNRETVPGAPEDWTKGAIFETGETRYELLELLGRGAIGEVFLARDLRLQREVALKRLFSQSPEAAERLLVEAKRQARVDHPWVCKVYGYGELDKRPYIALQFASGGTLAQRYKELSQSARVKLIARVALAIDAAHQIGLVHRDLKPTNILCERSETPGEWLPLVADFGVARAVDQPTTQSGHAVGTPAYMAPEQAEGKHVDHRVDVYALGVTLYELVCGKRPFEGDVVKVIRDVIETEPPAPRTIEPTVARDLESIILRCLEKQADRRYPTARALADDLERYLLGEPVVARPATVAYRVSRWARRRRGYVALGLAGLLGTGVALGLALRARASAAERSRIAQRLGRELQRVETELELAHLRPPHDVSRDRKRLAGELGEVRALVDGAPVEAEAAGRVVLARALLLVGDPAAADRELETAAALGDRSVELHVARGETLLAMHRRAAVELDSMGRDLRKLRAEELRKTYLVPAAEALGRGRSSRQALVAAELAVAEGRGDDALAAAKLALDADPFLAQAHVLSGNVLRDRALAALGTAACDDAATALAAAQAEFEAARQIARSLPDAHVGLCGAAVLKARLALCRREDALPPIDAAEAVCAAGEAIDPTREELLQYPVSVRQLAAQLLLSVGKDPSEQIVKLLAMNEAARRRFPEARWSLAIEATAWELRADQEFWSGKDPRASIEKSLAAHIQVNRDAPRMATLNNMAGVYKTLGDYLVQIGEDPRQAYADGLAAAEKAVELAPDQTYPWFTVATLASGRANWDLERGNDPTASYAAGEAAFRQLLRLSPEDSGAYNGLAITAWGRGVWLAGSGGEPTELYELAVASYRKARELDPEGILPPYNLAEALRYLAWHRLGNGLDAAPLLEEARKTIDELAAKKPQNLEAVEEESAALELAAARAPGADVAARLGGAFATLRRLPENPRRMGLRAIAVAHARRAGVPVPANEVERLQAWAASQPGHESDLVKAVLALSDAPESRAAVVAATKQSVFLRYEALALTAR